MPTLSLVNETSERGLHGTPAIVGGEGVLGLLDGVLLPCQQPW